LLHPKKVGKIPVAGTDKIKQTNEIKMVKPLLNALNIDGLVITVDAGHGRIERRRIWVTNSLNDYLSFPYVKQVFAIERESINKKTGVVSEEMAYGITSQCERDAIAMQILHTNRGHWCIENSCHYILDWAYDEDRCRIRTGYGPENISRIRRFSIGVIKSVSSKGVAETTRDLVMNVRLVFDYLKMTKTHRVNL
jgi:predicted transposase YbfD/YdcC